MVLLDLIKHLQEEKFKNHDFYYKEHLENCEKSLVKSLDKSQWEKFEDYKTALTDFTEEKTDYEKLDILYFGIKIGMEFSQFLKNLDE